MKLEKLVGELATLSRYQGAGEAVQCRLTPVGRQYEIAVVSERRRAAD